ncbi:transcription factor 19 [Latimeria chalumnae]|uniref:transcription factor 19 n=1 Tax=Latimeria chalumnae TaxID=7897 RepID=UPI0003C1761C|nr:PREDICTED: transcription factor 19 [Latimeria chalumnae]|eukprot:XP_005998189.1 PREDICTED: transcription factor 19 [Latimeria chalumnae]
MLSEVQPCFQLLRIGPSPVPGSASPVSRDLYTFRPVLPRCSYRLGRRAEVCDVTLVSERDPTLISRVHAEIHAERDGSSSNNTVGEWRVYIVDRSAHGTFVNDVRLRHGQRVELSDGDMVTFGHADAACIPEGSVAAQPEAEFYFLFQKVRVRPEDFDAITTPKAEGLGGFKPVSQAGTGLGSREERIRELTRRPMAAARATLILNSIGSLSKLKPQPLTFHPEKAKGSLDSRRGAAQGRTQQQPPSCVGLPSGVVPWQARRNRRKTVHTVLPELEDEVQQRFTDEASVQQKRRQCKSESDVAELGFHSPLRSRIRERGTNEEPEEEQRRRCRKQQQHVQQKRRRLESGGQTETLREELQRLHVTPTGKRRGRPRKHPLGEVAVCRVISQTLYAMEQCAARPCRLPQDETVAWVQCDDCDAWYHVACVGCNYSAVQEADFHCGCA